jgi:hypothetical protein
VGLSSKVGEAETVAKVVAVELGLTKPEADASWLKDGEEEIDGLPLAVLVVVSNEGVKTVEAALPVVLDVIDERLLDAMPALIVAVCVDVELGVELLVLDTLGEGLPVSDAVAVADGRGTNRSAYIP